MSKRMIGIVPLGTYRVLRTVVLRGRARVTRQIHRRVGAVLDDIRVTEPAIALGCRVSLRCGAGGRMVMPMVDVVFMSIALSGDRWRDVLAVAQRVVASYDRVTSQGSRLAYAIAEELMAAGRPVEANECCRYGGHDYTTMAQRAKTWKPESLPDSGPGNLIHISIPMDGSGPMRATKLDLVG